MGSDPLQRPTKAIMRTLKALVLGLAGLTAVAAQGTEVSAHLDPPAILLR
jgi:hypothetical protein